MIDLLEARDLVLCRSDAGDGGWSLHTPGPDAAIAEGANLPLLTGLACRRGDGWSRPSALDYARALEAWEG